MKVLVIATPCYTGDVSAGYALSLVRSVIVGGFHGINVVPMMECGNAIVEHARNVLVARFLEIEEADSLLFVDSDLSWDEKAVLRMYDSPYEVVGGTYPKKLQEGSQFLGHYAANQENGFIEATQLPAGFLLVRRSAFLKMAETVPEYYDPLLKRKNHAWFETCIRSGALNGEDYEFSERWKAVGGKMWCWPDIYFEHTGRKIWQGNFMETLNAKARAQRSEHAGQENPGEVHGDAPDAPANDPLSQGLSGREVVCR